VRRIFVKVQESIAESSTRNLPERKSRSLPERK
jgi:hypothetical protein